MCETVALENEWMKLQILRLSQWLSYRRERETEY